MFGFLKTRKFPPSFAGKPLFASEVGLELIYDSSGDESEEWRLFKEQHQVELTKGEMTIRGRRLATTGDILKIFITGLGTLLIYDETPYQDTHAFTLEGEHLWDIEGCNFEIGKKSYSLGVPNIIKRDDSGRDLLLLSYYPAVFATDLHTGKGTYLWAMRDDTDEK